tara:strand:- start:2145 stop:2885 length:741 start_codon:yes stop_codon:yes gene_type:complete
MKEIRFFAMMRSGQHAVINWLLAQLPKPHTFINDPLHPVQRFGKKRLAQPNDLYYVYNIEDRFILDGAAESEEKLHDYSDVRDGGIINVLILRDPFNLFASRYARETARKNLATGEKQHEEIRNCSWSPLEGWTSKKALECWKNHVKEVRSPTIINLIVNYNEWVLSEEYRKSLSEFFEVEFNDVGYEKLAIVQGEGSSFDGIQKLESSKVLKRYKKYIYDGYFMSLFDKETVALAEDIFGWTISL